MTNERTREELLARLDELERQVAESEGRYHGLFDSMLDGYALHEMIYDEDGRPVDYRFLEINPAFERLTGLKAKDIVGRTVQEALPGIEQHWIDTYGKIATEGGSIRFENHSAILDRHYEVKAYQPRQGYFACAFADVTERRALEEQVRQAQKMEAIGTLAGGVAHDFNNLLTGILGYANLLKLGSQPGEHVYKSADVIERAAERAAELAQQLLGFARKGKLEERPVDMRRVIGDVVAILGRTIHKGITLRQSYGDGTATVSGDPGQLQQVVMNLAVNAADAMSDGGELTFDVHLVELDDQYCSTHPEVEPGPYVQLSVTDTGTGIPDDVRERVFEPFFTTKEQGRGTGMGLATTYGIVKNHSGSIQLYSEMGQGTTFKVYLPPIVEEEPDWADMPSQEAMRGSGLVMVVDDEETVCLVVKAMLEAIGYEAVTVPSGAEAVAYFADHAADVDLVILDWAMPEMDGQACFRELRKIDPGVRALLATGHAFNGAARDVLDEGMVGFVQKPFLTAALAKAVARALDDDGDE